MKKIRHIKCIGINTEYEMLLNILPKGNSINYVADKSIYSKIMNNIESAKKACENISNN